MKSQCIAKAKGTGERCRRSPIAGGTVCRVHGGAAPAVKAKALQRQALQSVTADARAILAVEDVEPLGDPVLVLAGLAARLSATERALAARVNALDRLSYTSVMGTEQLRSEVALWGQWHDRLVKTLEILGKLGLDERRVRITQLQAMQLVDIVKATLDALELSPDQRKKADSVLHAELLKASKEDEMSGGS